MQVMILMKNIELICSNWPTIIPDEIVLNCLAAYQHHSTVWQPSLICCVCGLLVEQQDVQEIDVSDHSTCSLDFIVLHAKDPLITDLSTDFQYGFHIIDDCSLHKKGFKQSDKDNMYVMSLR